MENNYEQELEAAAETYATGNHRASFADTSDMKAFKAGATWQTQRSEKLVEAITEYCDLHHAPKLEEALKSYEGGSNGK